MLFICHNMNSIIWVINKLKTQLFFISTLKWLKWFPPIRHQLFFDVLWIPWFQWKSDQSELVDDSRQSMIPEYNVFQYAYSTLLCQSGSLEAGQAGHSPSVLHALLGQKQQIWFVVVGYPSNHLWFDLYWLSFEWRRHSFPYIHTWSDL